MTHSLHYYILQDIIAIDQKMMCLLYGQQEDNMADMLGILGDWVDKAPSLLNWFLKKIYKEEGIKERIVIDLTSKKSTIGAQLFDNAYINVILRIANFTPFELTVENITLEFRWDGISKKIHKNNFGRK